MPAKIAKTPPIRRQVPISQFKMLSEDTGTFSGYLAVYNNEDQGGDIIDTGASAKTLGEAKALQTKRLSQGAPSGRYLWPIFGGHDDRNAIGGFTVAREDVSGLFVEAELDMDIEEGRRAYSGMKKGYAAGLSIGYFATKYHYDQKGRRHLTEIAIFEGSITPIPMNIDAIVTEVKSATGKADWPLADRGRAWDNGAAHKRIVAWATDDSGNVDTGKLKSVHFYSPDGDAAENVSEYKLLYCDQVGDEIQAIPRAIFACAGSHGVDALEGVSASDKDSIKGKISAYYRRIAKAENDDSIVAPWDATQKGKRMPTDRQHARKARNFDTLFQSLNAADDLQDEWGDTFIAFTRAMSELMYEAQAQANGWLPVNADMPTIDPVEAAQANLDAFSTAVIDLVRRSAAAAFAPCLDNDGDQFLDPDGCNADEGDKDDSYYMSRDTSAADTKAGRVMSAANHGELGGMVDDMGKTVKALTAQHKALQAFHAKVDPNAKPGDASSNEAGAANDTTSQDDTGKGKAMQQPNTEPEAGRHGDDTTSQGNATPLTADDVQRLIRQQMQAHKLAGRVEARLSA